MDNEGINYLYYQLLWIFIRFWKAKRKKPIDSQIEFHYANYCVF